MYILQKSALVYSPTRFLHTSASSGQNPVSIMKGHCLDCLSLLLLLSFFSIIHSLGNMCLFAVGAAEALIECVHR